MTVEERLAVLEQIAKDNKEDIDELFSVIRRHMEQEEKDRIVLMKQLNDLTIADAKQKSFVGGIVFTITAVWALITAAVAMYFKTRG